MAPALLSSTPAERTPGSPLGPPLKDSWHCEKLRLQGHLQSFWMLKGKSALMSVRPPSLRGIANSLRAELVPMAAVITLASGAANLYSAPIPAPSTQRGHLRSLPPMEFRHLTSSVALLIGLALVFSAINIRMRRRRAFRIVLTLSLYFRQIFSPNIYAKYLCQIVTPNIYAK